ncbi:MULTISPECIES: hypothetical protein [Paraburkholderia]|uniref:hypothetical protein n=1 Tax=Paraburkholderia TaxID=1822464 RepID=UPI00224D3698|nr:MULTISPECIES: hypothetical protein [Paraburkholderia]MCX4159674.1 hypothetical protein [Paraburkholderia aspalathi]MDN7169071.1 hypothetical protein [Paraburkholderia sp. SECH2]MDQ6397559.1 hypothetical protein [Paraburkholderia aspalathi]
MTESHPDFLPLRVINVGADGKRSFDKRDKQRLIKACLEPGESVAGMTLKAGVNANQLRAMDWQVQGHAQKRIGYHSERHREQPGGVRSCGSGQGLCRRARVFGATHEA